MASKLDRLLSHASQTNCVVGVVYRMPTVPAFGGVQLPESFEIGTEASVPTKSLH